MHNKVAIDNDRMFEEISIQDKLDNFVEEKKRF